MDNEVVTQEVPLEEVSSADYKKARLEGKSVIEKEPPIEEPAEKEPEEVEQEEETEVEPKPKAKGGGFQKRIEKLTKDKSKAEERAAELERRVKELESKSTVKEEKPAKSATDEPQEADYTDFTKYLKDHVRWEVRQELKEQAEAAERETLEEQAKETWEGHQGRMEAAKEKYEDFDEVVDVPTPWAMTNPSPIERAAAEAFRIAVIEDDNGPEILYHLGQNAEEFAKLGEMTPAQVVKAVARLSDKLAPKAEKEPAKPKLVSKAPAPIKPVSGGATKNSTPLDQVDMAEYKKRRAAGERG
jgi:hypothetical protein